MLYRPYAKDYGLAKSVLNNRSDSRGPSTVRATDFALPTGFEDEALVVKPIEAVSIEAFPCPGAIVQRQIKERKHSLADYCAVGIPMPSPKRTLRQGPDTKRMAAVSTMP